MVLEVNLRELKVRIFGINSLPSTGSVLDVGICDGIILYPLKVIMNFTEPALYVLSFCAQIHSYVATETHFCKTGTQLVAWQAGAYLL